MKNYSLYYQAYISKRECWYVTAILRSFEHVAFDRTLDPETTLFEFFVPQDMEPAFLQIMHYFVERKLVAGLRLLSNRLASQGLSEN